jgi:hypothetical protein
MLLPSLVTMPRRSPSPSKARPSSASVACSAAIRSRRFSGLLGSGWWLGKLPSTSLNSSITSQPMRAQDGRAPTRRPMPLPQSTTIFIGRASRMSPRCARCRLGRAHRRRTAPPALGIQVSASMRWRRPGCRRRRWRGRHHHLEAVVVLRVVAAGDLDAAVAGVLAAKYSIGVVTRPTSITSMPAATRPRISAAPAPGPTGGRRGPRPPPSRPRPAPRMPKARPRCSATASSMVADDAADVVGLEDGGWTCMGVRFAAEGGSGHCRQARRLRAATCTSTQAQVRKRRVRRTGPVPMIPMHGPRRRCRLPCREGARCALRRALFRRRHLHRRLLPPGVPRAHAAARELPLLRHPRAGRGGRLQALPEVPAGDRAPACRRWTRRARWPTRRRAGSNNPCTTAAKR